MDSLSRTSWRLTQHEIETQHGTLASYEGVRVVGDAEGLKLFGTDEQTACKQKAIS